MVEQFRDVFAPRLLGMDVRFQRRFDNELKALDGVLAVLGSNIVFCVSASVSP